MLVIGTGAAGLRAAIELAESGQQVLCVGTRRTDDAHSVLAAGGINAALGTMDPEDSWQQHAADTIAEAGDGFNLERHLQDIERSHLERALGRAGGVQTHAADALGLSFRQFRYLVKKYGIK